MKRGSIGGAPRRAARARPVYSAIDSAPVVPQGISKREPDAKGGRNPGTAISTSLSNEIPDIRIINQSIAISFVFQQLSAILAGVASPIPHW